jgi:hypothetical protein
MNILRQQVRDALVDVTPFDLGSRIRALVDALSPFERTAAIVSKGLLETGVDAEQYLLD